MLDVENKLFSICAPKSIYTNIFLLLGNTIPKNKVTNANNNIESRLTMAFSYQLWNNQQTNKNYSEHHKW